ncbi:hypothetical protein QFZ64_004474 [Streptomyces sp. B3I8]|nr:hypothetical protein [Streptomyces sp. B3I8]
MPGGISAASGRHSSLRPGDPTAPALSEISPVGISPVGISPSVSAASWRRHHVVVARGGRHAEPAVRREVRGDARTPALAQTRAREQPGGDAPAAVRGARAELPVRRVSAGDSSDRPPRDVQVTLLSASRPGNPVRLRAGPRRRSVCTSRPTAPAPMRPPARRLRPSRRVHADTRGSFSREPPPCRGGRSSASRIHRAYEAGCGATGPWEGHRTGFGPCVRSPCPAPFRGSPGRQERAGPTPQNLMLPIIPAMFVVRSLIVGAIVEEAR